MAFKNRRSASEDEVTDLLKKILIVQLFQLDVPQVLIAKKLRLSPNAVNDLLKGIKKGKG